MASFACLCVSLAAGLDLCDVYDGCDVRGIQHLCAYEIGWAHYFQLNWAAAIPLFQRYGAAAVYMNLFARCVLVALVLPTKHVPFVRVHALREQTSGRKHVEQGVLRVHGGGALVVNAPLDFDVVRV